MFLQEVIISLLFLKWMARTGEIINAANTNGSFYGGLIDKEGNLWAASRYYHGGVRVLKVSNDLSTSELIDAGVSLYMVLL
jgi:hypothetical protein